MTTRYAAGPLGKSEGHGLIEGGKRKSDWSTRRDWGPEQHLRSCSFGDAPAADEEIEGPAKGADGAQLVLVW